MFYQNRVNQTNIMETMHIIKDSPRKILIAVDCSENSRHAFNYYITRIFRPGDSAILVYVCDPNPNCIMSAHQKEMGTVQEATKLFTELQAQCMAKHISATMVTRSGVPGEQILNIHRQQNVEMIVLGSRGLGAIQRTIFGSVSDYVLHRASVPVVVVPPVGN